MIDETRGNPQYPKLTPAVQAWRRQANGRDLTHEETCAYGRAVLDAIRSLNGVRKHAPISMASTGWTQARQQAQIRADIARGVANDRSRRTDKEIIAQYEAHMAEQRARLAAPPISLRSEAAKRANSVRTAEQRADIARRANATRKARAAAANDNRREAA